MSVNPNQLSGVFADRLDNWLVPDQHYSPRTLMFTRWSLTGTLSDLHAKPGHKVSKTDSLTVLYKGYLVLDIHPAKT